MKLVLHIGTEKTGTTSLQKWMGANRPNLRKQGIVYPRTLGQSRHIKASVYAADMVNADKIAYRMQGITDEASLGAFRNTLQQQFHKEIARSRAEGHRTTFISDEGLQAVLRNQGEIRRLRSELLSVFDDITVIICLRPQVDYGVSLASTFSRLGFTISSKWFETLSPDFPRFNYNSLVHAWENVFGSENVRLASYKRNPRSVPFFKEILGIGDDDVQWTEVDRENSFVDWRYIRLINQAKNPARDDLRAVLDRLPHFQKLELGAAMAARIARQFDDSNQKLVGRRDDILMSDLTPDLDSGQPEGNFAQLGKPLDHDGLVLDLIHTLACQAG